MIIVILKDGYTFSFEMTDFDKERTLVNKFCDGGLSPTTTLDLKAKGIYKVEEIQDMQFQPVRVLRRANQH